MMRFWLKAGGMVLSLSLILSPVDADAKQRHHNKHKVSHQNINKKFGKSASKKKYSKYFSKKSHKNYSKRNIVKVSYSYGPRVYVAKDIEPNTEIYKYAVGLLGTRYKFGGEGINGIDCSSFVQNVFELAGYKMPRTAREQARYGYFVRKEDLKPGDLLFFATYAPFPSHVGIYIGDGKMIHASSKGNRVEVTSINQDYYQKRFLFAKRIPANFNDIEDIKDIENYMEESYIYAEPEAQKESKKDMLKSKKDSDIDPIAKIIKEKNEN